MNADVPEISATVLVEQGVV